MPPRCPSSLFPLHENGEQYLTHVNSSFASGWTCRLIDLDCYIMAGILPSVAYGAGIGCAPDANSPSNFANSVQCGQQMGEFFIDGGAGGSAV
jgi:hypothetical protein